jgi:hypothetical protein
MLKRHRPILVVLAIFLTCAVCSPIASYLFVQGAGSSMAYALVPIYPGSQLVDKGQTYLFTASGLNFGRLSTAKKCY